MKTGALEFRHHSKLTEYPAANAVTFTSTGATETCPLTHPVVRVDATAEAITTFTLPDGEEGQLLTLIGMHANDTTITPTTSTFIDSATLSVIGDQITLLYIDDTDGWMVISTLGVAQNANPAYVVAT